MPKNLLALMKADCVVAKKLSLNTPKGLQPTVNQHTLSCKEISVYFCR